VAVPVAPRSRRLAEPASTSVPTSAPAFIGLGGNLGDVPATLASARDALRLLSGTPLRTSGLYASEPWGETRGPAYVNQVAALTYAGSPAALLGALMEIEARLGRVRTVPNAPRTLDLDLLTFGDHRCDTPDLTLPHPRLHLRRFVLLPWSELAPDVTPPGLGRSIRALLADCPDPGSVWPLSA
jgi:2-amino-4-hydroxy-6-hydroxymethyldihydropteridine diphosphokinase